MKIQTKSVKDALRADARLQYNWLSEGICIVGIEGHNYAVVIRDVIGRIDDETVQKSRELPTTINISGFVMIFNVADEARYDIESIVRIQRNTIVLVNAPKTVTVLKHVVDQNIQLIVGTIYKDFAIPLLNLPSGGSYVFEGTREQISRQSTVSSTRRSRRSNRPTVGASVDSYRLVKRLGAGASAEVWLAETIQQIPGVELDVGQQVALKLYNQFMLQHQQTMRIQREFSVASALEHPNLARVYDLLLSPSRPIGAFMSMEFIDGKTLKSVIENVGRLSVAQSIDLSIAIFDALAELHSHNAIHRDVKAANIMLVEGAVLRSAVKLVDLGIVAVEDEHRVTAVSAFVGSKHSAPLEQLVGEEVDHRSDIYAAGSVLYHMLTGRPMYHNVGPEAAIAVRMTKSPQFLDRNDFEDRQLADARLRRLVEFVNSCIAVERRNRPSTSSECANELRSI